jgi:hypothetical protein
MMNDRPERGQDAREGLCASCRHRREIVSVRGSRFVLCERSRTDPSFPRYPGLPVRTCRGYERAESSSLEVRPQEPSK